MLEKLLELAKNISSEEIFLKRVKAYSDKDQNPEDNPFKSTEECRQYLIDGIENGTLKTREDIYKVFGLEIINCKSGEVIAYIQ